MSSADADDVSPSPDPEDHSAIMAGINGERASSDDKSSSQQPISTNPAPSAKSNAKDPSRPRRKKARRACFACQRAHLTCGDERPCLRCIKRGLQDQCCDGVRKKAKYLHDAPADALIPGFPGNYHIRNGSHTLIPDITPPVPSSGLPIPQSGSYFSNGTAPNFAQQFGPASQQGGQMGPPLMEHGIDFSAPPNVETPPHYPRSSSSQQTSPLQEMTQAMEPANTVPMSVGAGSFDSSFFDANDPSLLNFNISDLNFGNHYGALEFGMLGHMSGAVGTPDAEHMNPMGQNSMSFDASGYNQGYGLGQPFSNWHNAGSRNGSAANIWTSQNNGADAYAIGEQPPSLADQSPRSQEFTVFNVSPENTYAQPEQGRDPQDLLKQSISQAQQHPRKQSAFPGALGPYQIRRRRHTSEIYSSVTAPYSHTKGFHALTACLQKRFPSKKVLRIAKALASIRPSFISCNQSLDTDDLIHMEKCFQRTLSEYDDFINAYGTPTIIFRRTGEVAGASKEFSLVTGWRRDVLLGNEPNLNVNTGGNSNTSGSATGTSSRGAVTPRMPHVDIDPGRPQPVFIAELLDEDSVVEFYEDFAEAAFGGSRTTLPSKPCSLVRYRTKNDPAWEVNNHVADDDKRNLREQAGLNALGQRDGRVHCQLCWTVKRDTFDMPMMVVMNFLPVI